MTSATAMYGAIMRNDVSAVRGVVARDPSVLSGVFIDNGWLHWAAQMGRIEIMALLVEAGLRIDQMTASKTPLEIAAGQGHQKACQWLLDHGADINHGLGKSATPIFGAIYSKSLELVKLFVERGSNLGATFGVPEIDVIGFAKRYGTPEIVAFLRDRK